MPLEGTQWDQVLLNPLVEFWTDICAEYDIHAKGQSALFEGFFQLRAGTQRDVLRGVDEQVEIGVWTIRCTSPRAKEEDRHRHIMEILPEDGTQKVCVFAAEIGYWHRCCNAVRSASACAANPCMALKTFTAWSRL